MRATLENHDPRCIASAAWDIPEAYDHCSCEFPYPYPICSECYNRPHQHKRTCSRHPSRQATVGQEAP